MKRKYSLKIADMEIDVLTDATPESVNQVVGMLDRRIREILLKSHTCTKNEAALLCALGFCSDMVSSGEQIRELNDKLYEQTTQNEILKARIAELEAKLVVAENTENPVQESNPEPVSDAIAEEKVNQDTPTEEPRSEEPVQRKIKAKSKVGTMFDLLTFTDV